jgi:hypothetical protein
VDLELLASSKGTLGIRCPGSRFLEFLGLVLGYSASFRPRTWWSGCAVVVFAGAFESRKPKSVYAVAVDSVTSVSRDLGCEFVVAVDS